MVEPRWWAVFFLIAAPLFFAQAWRRYRASGSRIENRVVGAVTLGLGALAMAAVFYLRIPWGKAWLLFVAVGGVGFVLNAMKRR
jgi:hypothetical protein